MEAPVPVSLLPAPLPVPARRRRVRALLSLQRRLEARRPVKRLLVPVPGAPRPYEIAVPANPDGVLDELARALGAGSVPQRGGVEPYLPYWATLWPSGLALAEAVLQRRAQVAGRRALELGCGLGVTAVAALQAGARLAVADCFAEALAYCRYNALVNTGAAPRTLLADWRLDAGRRRLVRAGPFALVLAADVLYEREDVEPLLALVPRLVAPGGWFWLAEPGRATSAEFVRRAAAIGWRAETVTQERDWPAGAGAARVTIHLYRR
jgi:predicted nicotinamide N-methyase